MSNNIFEELPSRKGGAAKPMGDAAASIEKKARQLVYDSRYEVKKMLAGKKADAAMQERMVLERIAKSTAVPAVKARARQMVSKKAAVAEDFIPTIEDAAATSIANAMFKVFVEGVNEEEVVLDYLEELNSVGDKKYKIRVTDPKTGNSYVRYGTREKITQLRSKGLKVELTEYGEPREGERKRGEETARATGGGGRRGRKRLDPVGKEDGDIDNDGDKDKSDAYLMKRRNAIGAAIKNRNTVSASYEMDGEMIDESQIGDRARRVVGDQRQGVHGDADAMKQDMDAINLNLLRLRPYGVKGFPSVKKDVKNTTQVAHFEPDGKLVESSHKKTKKSKKTTEPRWQDSDGDGKWYEPGEDVRKEDYLWSEGTDSTEGKNKSQITGKGVDNYASGVIKISPDDGTQLDTKPKNVYAHTELEGEVLTERAKSKAQQRFMALVYKKKKEGGEASPEVEAAAKGMTKKEAKKYAKTKHKGLPEKVEEAMHSPADEEKKDTRGDYAKVNLVKNKLRAMGAKNPVVMVACEETVEEGAGLSITASNLLGKVFSNKRTSEAEATKAAQKNITDPVGFAIKGAVKGAAKTLGGTADSNEKMTQKRRPQTDLQKRVAAKTQQVVNQSYEMDGNVISEREFDEPGEESWRDDVRSHNRYVRKYKPYKKPSGPKPENPGPGSQAKPAD
jgi:hypothetical protein